MTATATQRNGRATIVLRDGRTFVSDRTDIAGSRISFTGRLRIRDLSGERFYPTQARSLALREVRAIYWHKAGGAA
jgi:hypothetical protein